MLPIILDAATPADELLADKAYDSDKVREDLLGRGMHPVIPNKDDRRFLYPFDRKRYRARRRFGSTHQEMRNSKIPMQAVYLADLKRSR